jgi:hypothetical protein
VPNGICGFANSCTRSGSDGAAAAFLSEGLY